jgi:Ca2+-binding EF-hand superfamily protein
MANQFSDEQRREILQAFKLFDKDNDNSLTKQVPPPPSRK